jgi:hypothetical protein
MNNSHFSIQVYDSLIVVDLTGDWSQQDDLSYISALAEKMAPLQRNSWGILVDMRGWIAQEEATLPKFKITLDRLNQKVECWIVDNMSQGDFLLSQFASATVKPMKFLNPSDAIIYVQNAGFKVPESTFLTTPLKTSLTD